MAVRLCLPALAAIALAGPLQAAEVEFAGRYGHRFTAAPGQPVWLVERDGDGYRATTVTGDGDVRPARVLSEDGRRAFWKKMLWDEADAAQASCLNWGDPPPPTLREMLAEAPAAPAIAGASLLCHVPAAQRARMTWLVNRQSDWFYYDPMAGVMEADRLP